MSETNSTGPAGYNAGQSCGASLEQHIEDIAVVLIQLGMGRACVDVYRALAEVAEGIRRYNNFAPHQASGNYVFDAFTKADSQPAQGYLPPASGTVN